jgi:hypothetical protein
LILGAEPGLRIRRAEQGCEMFFVPSGLFSRFDASIGGGGAPEVDGDAPAMARLFKPAVANGLAIAARCVGGCGGDADDGGGRPDDCRMKGDGIDGDDRALQSILFRPPAAVRRDGRALVGLAFDGRLTEPAAARGGEDQNEGGGRAEPAPWRWLAYGAKRFHREVLPSIATNSGRSG